jgi:hypothetical protein
VVRRDRLPGGSEVDLTRDQFAASEHVGVPEAVERPADVTGARLEAQYRILAARVRTALAMSSPDGAGPRMR